MKLDVFFETNNKVAVAFSGGTDSAYVLYAAKKYGAEIKAYYVKSQFQPEFEFDDAVRFSKEINADMEVIAVNVLDDDNVCQNSCKRCYYCKTVIMQEIIKRAAADGYNIIIDGTNASDQEDDRPGMAVLKEKDIWSPLKLAGITKEEVRRLSREAMLFTADKPAYACLATRIKTGQQITAEKLSLTEKAEDYLFKLGFRDFRVRFDDYKAIIQVKKNQFSLYYDNEQVIKEELLKNYREVYFDINGR